MNAERVGKDTNRSPERPPSIPVPSSVSTRPPKELLQSASGAARTVLAGRALPIIGIALLLNSFFAMLGSVLWGFAPLPGTTWNLGYWPAYMISALATAYLGRWGLLLAALSPIVSSFVGTADAPFYLYVGVNVFQMSLVWAAFRFLKISPSLSTNLHRVLYLVFVIVVPSALGGASAWHLRSLFPNVHDGPLGTYVLNWTTENLLPALFPGLWLHKVVGEFYRPFDWESGGRPRSWVRTSVDNALPWVVSLLTVGVMLIMTVVRVIDLDPRKSPGLHAPGQWTDAGRDVVKQIPGFPWTVLVLLVSFLCSLGYSIRHAKQSWVLSEAVRRHFPNQRISDLLMSGITAPTEEMQVSIVVSDIRGFGVRAADLSPREEVTWLNEYFAYMTEACLKHSGSVDKLVGDSVVMVFGLTTGSSHARQALRCALDVVAGIEALNRRLQRAKLPPVEFGVAVHSGQVVSGEIGPAERRQYSILGDAVTTCQKLERESRDLPEDFHMLMVSRDSMRSAGLLGSRTSLVELSVTLPNEESPRSVFAIEKGRLSEFRV